MQTSPSLFQHQYILHNIYLSICHFEKVHPNYPQKINLVHYYADPILYILTERGALVGQLGVHFGA
jgi:hypothetical protein